MSRPYLLFLLLLVGCCANNRCDCNSARADALALQFAAVPDVDADPTHFGVSEVDTVIVLRYAVLPGAATPLAHDSVALVRSLARANDLIYLDNTAPFAAVGGRKLDAFRYRVRVLRNDRQRKYFDLDSIGLRGQYVGDGCCTCYRNTRKTARLDGSRRVDVTDRDGMPQPLVLTKK